jgi:hypothetical protein
MEPGPRRSEAILLRLRYLKWFERWARKCGVLNTVEGRENFQTLWECMASITRPGWWLAREGVPLKRLLEEIITTDTSKE